ncbi:aminopeptidase [Tepidibacillus fermentans]|uniref:Aminopeptidase II n=1 Tax=Tepidibacillus fermentans TaxID=1281767 RepID=A0A4R3KHH3_9BACI|nr:aminopeptidase [Tepidibacillus fermentans]TCS82121.1 aminopeptidase II [Tepidibacillus fermentans]
MNSFERNLDKYAELAVKVGINVQPGQTLVINAPLTAADFVRKIAKKAYEVGAKNVHVEWNDEKLARIKYDLAPDEAFKEFPMWKAKGFEEMAENGAGFMSIISSDPDLLKGVDPKRIATFNKTAGLALQKYREYVLSDRVSWTVIGVPSKEWAAKVFPGLSEEEQIAKLWDAIFKVSRVDVEDPIQAWKEHNENLLKKVNYLNEKKYKKLHYKAKGTDLTIELPEEHIWLGGGGENQKDVYFNPNIPTEEVFTLPLKNGVNGVVRSTKPLNYSGNLIDNFSLTFKDGRIVDFTAEQGYDILKTLIETDEGSHYLGEVALVPYDSPISQTNILFYNTLYDENASCHLAIGSAYSSCLENGTNLSKEELKKKGANQSITHVDFMIGSRNLDIDGETKDGKLEPIFRQGNWAF